ncbi:ATP-dependent helicase (plasmid) [Azospirillum oryzae]|uniref:DNA 3'-5' helicase n=1 Tax=Azospirillum oryzae TaxID=286727 RepID=A0A6N1ARZ2_9PROT|nr:ATP-dependent helicase [Azospirillum oryzae]KAA0587912.1 ATP-dependent helicase [Azospirillum oryzae]QKS54028.1 ATP-dependent helicase [Azospirillum oryzae]
MSKYVGVARALADLERNPEQFDAAHERGHCVVLAGPGSGKTKTLTTAMARTLVEDVVDPRGVACITYNNECATELETRLAKLGIMSSERCFIGTVHSFALTQVIAPYARCIAGLLPDRFRVAARSECRAAVEIAHEAVFGNGGNPHDRWLFAEEKRRRDVDRRLPVWRGQNPELADFIEAYEAELRRNGLIDFNDMPLIAFRMIKDHPWIRDALRARFPVLFVDEYQDLGHALHELVLLLCFESGIRLFAVGDADQSIYGFTGANPELLESLTDRADIRTIRLRLNYRSGAKIIRASLGALGEDRDYRGVEGAHDGELTFWPVEGEHSLQAQHIAKTVLPTLLGRGFQLEQIAILYRAAWLGDIVVESLEHADTPFVRTDVNALVNRSSRLARFAEACAGWVTGGWRVADPPYGRLLGQALSLVYGGRASEAEAQALSRQLLAFLRSGIDAGETTHAWLSRFCRELIAVWQPISRNPHQEWEVCLDMMKRTDPTQGRDMPLNTFSGRIEGTGRVTLSTFHSAKGREFDAVVLFGINDSDIPNWRDRKSGRALREARRLFYVGVTRPRKELCLVYQEHHHSPWVAELYQRGQ